MCDILIITAVSDSATFCVAVATSVLSMESESVKLKLVCIGDGATGKTCLLKTYENGSYPQAYVPTVFHQTAKKVQYTFGGRLKMVDLALWDTAGQEEYKEICKWVYANTDVVMIVFSVSEPTSLDNVQGKWIKEVSVGCPGIPVILVGTKTDERNDTRRIKYLAKRELHPITYTEGVAMAKSIGAKAYVECSAREGENVEAVFDEAMEVFFRNGAKAYKEGASTTCCSSFSLLSLAGRYTQYRLTDQSSYQPEAVE